MYGILHIICKIQSTGNIQFIVSGIISINIDVCENMSMSEIFILPI
jgi:hypothetical protein